MARQITELAVNSLLSCKNFKMSNTQVIYDHWNCIASMFLFDNEIAIYNPVAKQLEITTCGWNTVTTRERLNGLPKVSVTQKNYQLYLNGQPWNGEPITIQL